MLALKSNDSCTQQNIVTQAALDLEYFSNPTRKPNIVDPEQSKKEGKNQESIQSSPTPGP